MSRVLETDMYRPKKRKPRYPTIPTNYGNNGNGTSPTEKTTVQVKRFASLGEFLREAEAPAKKRGRWVNDWVNNESVEQAIHFAKNGNEKLVAEAQKLIDQLDSVSEGAPRHDWLPSPVGAYGIMQEALAGRPNFMRNLRSNPDELSPVSIYVCTTSSAGVSAEEYMKRGTAILSLVMKLSQIRPVDLYVTMECDGGYKSTDAIQIIPVESRPLCIAQAAYLLTSTGFSRHLTYAYATEHQGSYLSWVSNHSYGSEKNPIYDANMRKYYELGENDLHIPIIGLYDPLLTDPVKWVNETLAKYNAEHDNY